MYDRATSFNNDLKIPYAILKEIQKLSDESFWNVIPKIKLLLSDIDIDFIDPVDKMREYQKNTTDALYKGHTTPLGNKVMADVVSQYLKNKKIVRH